MDDQCFADGVGTITVIGSTVRFDLVVLSPTEIDENGRATAKFRQRVIMPVEAFLHSARKFQEAAEAIAKAADPARENKTPPPENPRAPIHESQAQQAEANSPAETKVTPLSAPASKKRTPFP